MGPIVFAVLIPLLLIVAVIIASVPIARRRAERRFLSSDLPPLVIPVRPGGGKQVPPFRPASLNLPFRAPGDADVVSPVVAPERNGHSRIGQAPSETVRFRRPADEALQLLPGRLEVLGGEPRREEIRFVRAPGEA